MKILIIRLSAIGDTIHCLPVAAAIKERIPDCHVGWLVEPPAAPLVMNNPAVDQVFVLPKRAWVKGVLTPWKHPGLLSEIGGFWSRIRQSKFDVALDLQGLLKSAACAVASGAKMRLGFAGSRELSAKLLSNCLDVGDYFSPYRHVVELNLSLVDFLCQKIGSVGNDKQSVQFPLPEPSLESIAKVNNLLGVVPLQTSRCGRQGRPLAVLIPGTTWSSKVWPLESWCLLAQRISQELDYRVCLVGGAGDIGTNGQVSTYLTHEVQPADHLDLTGQTNLVDLIALFRRSQLVVGADTGPLHLAAAVGKPKVLGIYGSTPCQRNGPYGSQCCSISLKLWCQPCFAKVCPLSTLACLKELSVDKVVTEIEMLLGSQL